LLQDLEITTASGEPLWPESVQAVEYLRTRAAKMSLKGLRDRVRAAAQELENVAAAATESEARTRAFSNKWTIAEVVDHIAQTQVRAAEELRHLVAGQRPPGPPVYDGLRSGAAAWVPWVALMDGLKSANQELITLLASISDENAVPVGATAPSILVIHREPSATQIFSVALNWKEYALAQRLHLIDHRNQIQRLREALGEAKQ
jgi:hypothetical protein